MGSSNRLNGIFDAPHSDWALSQGSISCHFKLVMIFVCCIYIPLLLLQSPSIDRYLFALQSVGQAALVSLFKRQPLICFQQNIQFGNTLIARNIILFKIIPEKLMRASRCSSSKISVSVTLSRLFRILGPWLVSWWLKIRSRVWVKISALRTASSVPTAGY